MLRALNHPTDGRVACTLVAKVTRRTDEGKRSLSRTAFDLASRLAAGAAPSRGPKVDLATLVGPDVRPLYSGTREIRTRLATHGYEATEQTARAVCMADRTGRPLLVEGGTGVGKTELARALALGADAALIRLQCYEGIGEQQALYAWNHAKQILQLQTSAGVLTADVFAEEFLLERPLLAAIRSTQPTVLLIDEVDKAQIEFDALLLEVLSDFSVTIGEFGTITTTRRPLVILTAGGQRDLSDALRRRCHFLHLPSPSAPMERRILDHHVPDAEHRIERGLNSMATRQRSGREWNVVVASIGNSEGLLDYIVQFVGALRDSGVPCGPSGLIDAVDAVCWVDVGDREQVREALCCTMIHREVELPTFHALSTCGFRKLCTAVNQPQEGHSIPNPTPSSALRRLWQGSISPRWIPTR